MKKYSVLILIILMLFPYNVFAAVTLGEYEKKLADYISQSNANKAAINKTEAEIKASNNQISYIQQELKNMMNELGVLKEEVVEFNAEIKEKDAETKRLIEYYQTSSITNNAALEYAFGAESITELIYRLSVVEQMTEYNQNKIEELTKMVDKNVQREKDIHQKEKEMAVREKELEKEVVSLGEEKVSLETAGVSVAQQIKIYQELINSYKKAGCKSTDRIGIDCARSGDAGIFRRPTGTGYITQEFGYTRPGYLHRGIDIGSRLGSNTPLYSIGNGKITSIYKDTHGALCLTIEYYSAVKGSYYTALYAHLSRYGNISVGQNVTSNTVVGYMGNTGYSFGTHLHLEVNPCRLYNTSDTRCSTWYRYTNFVSRQVSSGYKGPRSLIGFPSFGVTWNSR